MAQEVLSDEGRLRVQRVLAKAADDIVFREALLKDPRAALKGSDLQEDEIAAVERLNRVGLEELGVNIRAFRSFLRDNGNSSPAIGHLMAVASKEQSARPQLTDDEKKSLEDVLREAASDPIYRQGLLTDPRKVLLAKGLSETVIETVEHLNRVGMEELGVDVRPLRAFLRDNGNSSPMAFAIGAFQAEGKDRK